MIQIENTEVMGWEAAIRGMRNPKNSWDKNDSYPAVDCGKCGRIEREGLCRKEERDCTGFECFEIGPNDYKLAKRLADAGPVHGKYLRMITVYADITGPLYWWKEYDTYKVGTVANSCSTMHKIAGKRFTLYDFSYEHLEGPYLENLQETIRLLNEAREMYLWELQQEKPLVEPKAYWWQMIQLLPSSYNQRRTVMLNYAVLANMYQSRKDHKLDEWHAFCHWVESLPYSELITGKEAD